MSAHAREKDPEEEWKVVDSLGDPRLSVKAPFHVEVHRDDDGVTLHDPDTDIFGTGEHELAALEDFQAATVELFLTLEDDRNGLGPALRETLRLLETKIQKRI